MFTQVWRLSGLTGSEPGHLGLRAGRLIYKPVDDGSPGFNVALKEVTEINFPWHYFTGGFKVLIGGEQFRFPFVQPHSEFADISGGREARKAWKKVLLET